MGKTSPSAAKVVVEGLGEMTAVAQEGGCEQCDGGVPPRAVLRGCCCKTPGEADPEPSEGAMPQACPQPPGTLPAPAGPPDPPVCQLGASAASSSTPAPPADRAPIEAGSCLTCSPPPPKGLQQWAACVPWPGQSRQPRA